jgi:hypothetical protein
MPPRDSRQQHQHPFQAKPESLPAFVPAVEALVVEGARSPR